MFDFEEFDQTVNDEPTPELTSNGEDAAAELDDQLDDVEQRLDVAKYYRTLLSGTLFSGEQSGAATVVTQRVRRFVREELRTLLGLASPKPDLAAVFSTEQVEALRAVADRLLQREQILVPRAAPTPEQLRPKAPEASPQLQTRSQPAAPRRAPAQPPKAEIAKPKPVKSAVPKGKRKVLQEAVTETGVKVVTSETNGRTITEYFNAKGDKLQELDRSPPIRSPDAVPPLNREQLEYISASQATETAAHMGLEPLANLLSQ